MSKPKRNRIETRLAGCPMCFKFIKVDASWTRYACPHCGVTLEGPLKPKNTTVTGRNANGE